MTELYNRNIISVLIEGGAGIFNKVISENMWDEIREKFFTNLVFDSMNAVEDKLEEAMIFYDKKREIVKSITGFNWITPYL
jgi:riboflavin biosynthesis pyrimidine reductase